MKRVILLVMLSVMWLFDFSEAQAETVSEKAETKIVKQQLAIKKGQVFSIVAPDTKAGGEDAISEYYQRAFPLAESLGLQRHMSLKVGSTFVGNYHPSGFIFFSWPDQSSENKLTNHAEWSEIKALRPLGWDELKIYSSMAKTDIDITFDSSKFYTLAVAWFNPDKPTDYLTYLDGIEETVESIGGRFILKVHHPRFEAHASPLINPGQITLVEWDSPEGLKTLQQSDAFKQFSPYLTSGVTAFELHNIVPVG
ncbi:hypothetical protein EYS14_22875 [Alteromonadaceae bacterium M269]|nr:hypothetical protein EYS14_22875 [Alteromonadaceae bacterium M269]